MLDVGAVALREDARPVRSIRTSGWTRHAARRRRGDARELADRPSQRRGVRRSGDRPAEELARLDDEYLSGLADCARDTVVSSHDAFGYLTRYGIEVAPIAGLTPEAEPTPAGLASSSS